MPAKTKKSLIITIVVIAAAALIAAAISFIYFPATVRLTSDVRCYDSNSLQFPLTDAGLQNADYTDISYDLTVTKHWFLVTGIDGRVQIDGEWNDIMFWDYVDGDYYCSLTEGTWSSKLKLNAFVLDGNFNSVRIIYNDGKYNENQGSLWYGPANTADELINVMADLGAGYYRSYQA